MLFCKKYFIALFFLLLIFIQGCSVKTALNKQGEYLCTLPDLPSTSNREATLKTANTLEIQGDKFFLENSYLNASNCFQQASKIRTDILGLKHTSLLKNLYNLATIYEIREEYNKAENSYKKALNILKNQPRPAPAKVNKSLGFLAAIRYQKSLKSNETKLQGLLLAFNQLHDPRNIRVASIYHRLANIFLNQKHFQKSETAFENALSILGQHTGNKHPYYAKIQNDYSKLLQQTKRESEAVKIQFQANHILSAFPKKQRTKLYQTK